MVRAIGTMGAVAALVGAVTFAQLTSNTVALTNNTLSSSTAALAIAPGNNTCNNQGGSGDTTSTQGFSNVKLTPGVPSAPLKFCLDNTGDVPLNITAKVTNPTGGTLDASKVTLNLTCDGATTLSFSLVDYYNGNATFDKTLNNGHAWNCNATATLASDTSGQGGQSVTPFDINFTGTEVTPST
jgi:FlaG/FlaF family flagellin (archaellin)